MCCLSCTKLSVLAFGTGTLFPTLAMHGGNLPGQCLLWVVFCWVGYMISPWPGVFSSLQHRTVAFEHLRRWVNCLLIREIPFTLAIRLWDTYLAEGARMRDFLTYVLAAFLLTWSPQLRGMDFQVRVAHDPCENSHYRRRLACLRFQIWVGMTWHHLQCHCVALRVNSSFLHYHKEIVPAACGRANDAALCMHGNAKW